jgi:hypothetical protein
MVLMLSQENTFFHRTIFNFDWPSKTKIKGLP